MVGDRRAVFVDRDGTVIREREYLADPAGVELIPGVVDGLRAFQSAGYVVVLVTNQSGIARGLYGVAEYRAVEREVEERLRVEGVHVAGSYHCPHHPDFSGPCDCRKPETGLFRKAAEEHGLALADSVFIGDRIRDVEPAVRLGGRGVLVRTGYGAEEADRAPGGVFVADDLAQAARLMIPSFGVDTDREHS